tara:strand:- start:332 stop:673 length:342 start_codon:yes stop_codon:yes gene_type:complete
MKDNKEIFKEFGKKIPKESYVIIIRDQPNGATDFMCYDSTTKKKLTDGYTVMRGITATILNDPEYLLERGQLAIYRDTKISKPDVEQPFILEQNSKEDDNVIQFEFQPEGKDD